MKRLAAGLLAAVLATGSVSGGMTVHAEPAYQGSGRYTADNPCELPSESGADHALRVEAEDFILDAANAAAGKAVRINDSANASEGKQVTWFEEGNRISLPFTVAKAGVYKVTARYISGRGESNPNALNGAGRMSNQDQKTCGERPRQIHIMMLNWRSR